MQIKREITVAEFDVGAGGIKITQLVPTMSVQEWFMLVEGVNAELHRRGLIPNNDIPQPVRLTSVKPDGIEWTSIAPDKIPKYKGRVAHLEAEDGLEIEYESIKVGTIIPGDFLNGTPAQASEFYKTIKLNQIVQRKKIIGYEPVIVGQSKVGDLFWNSNKNQWMAVENEMPAQAFHALMRKRA